jgi:ABC-type lipoprotein export system ATPase subunit
MSTGSTERLRASNLKKTYRSGEREIEVLTGVGLTLGQEDSLSIRGESGSGKSTLLNLLAGIEVPDDGEVLWEGVSLRGQSGSALATRRASFLGFVFQAYYLVPELTALDNVLLAARIAGKPLKPSRERALHLMERVGLKDRLQSRPEQLSGGERQRAAIARALMNQPAVLLADEPTGNLDERTAGRVMELLLETSGAEGASLILVTHHPAFAGMTKRASVLEQGRLLEA